MYQESDERIRNRFSKMFLIRISRLHFQVHMSAHVPLLLIKNNYLTILLQTIQIKTHTMCIMKDNVGVICDIDL